jgi:hypothetical protein
VQRITGEAREKARRQDIAERGCGVAGLLRFVRCDDTRKSVRMNWQCIQQDFEIFACQAVFLLRQRKSGHVSQFYTGRPRILPRKHVEHPDPSRLNLDRPIRRPRYSVPALQVDEIGRTGVMVKFFGQIDAPSLVVTVDQNEDLFVVVDPSIGVDTVTVRRRVLDEASSTESRVIGAEGEKLLDEVVGLILRSRSPLGGDAVLRDMRRHVVEVCAV